MIKNFAHRGFCSKYPENTMLAFEKALAEGIDGIENDIQLTKDGHMVLMHDETIDRTTDGKGYVKDYTLEELRKFNAGVPFGDQFGFQPIPTLREYLELVKNEPIITNIEMKTGVFEYIEMEQKLIDMLREYKIEDRILITSFNHYTIARMQKKAPDLKYGFLAYDWRLDAGEYTKRYGVPCYHPDYHNLTWEVVKDLHDHGIEVNPYTIDDPDDIRDMIDKGVNSVITNCPDVVNRVRAEYKG